MFKPLLTLVATLALVACGNTNETTVQKAAEPVETASNEVMVKSQTEMLNEWFADQYEQELLMSPIGLTFQGRKERYGEIDDMSEANETKQLEWKRKSVETMKAKFDYEQLTAAAAGEKFKRRGYVFEQMNGTHSFFPTLMMSFHPVANLEEMQAYVSRLSQIGRAMNQLIERAELAINEGVRPPRFAYEIVRKEALEIIAGQPFDDSENKSSLWNDANTKIDDLLKKELINEDQAKELVEQVRAALLNDLKPSYQSLVAMIDKDMANTTELAQGVHALPDGEAFYKYRLKQMTTTDMTASEIHELGLSEVARIRGEMEKIKDQVGFEGDLQAFFSYIRDSKGRASRLY